MQYTMMGVVSSFMHMVLIGEESKLSLAQVVEHFVLLCVYMYVFTVISLVKRMNEAPSYLVFFGAIINIILILIIVYPQARGGTRHSLVS